MNTQQLHYGHNGHYNDDYIQPYSPPSRTTFYSGAGSGGNAPTLEQLTLEALVGIRDQLAVLNTKLDRLLSGDK